MKLENIDKVCLEKDSFQLFDLYGQKVERNHNGEWFFCEMTIQAIPEGLRIKLENEYQKLKNTKPNKNNKSIACIPDLLNENTEYEIECNYIESNGNQTLIYGIIEDSGKIYDVLIACIPSSIKVILKPNK